jgi:hypothetical protein
MKKNLLLKSFVIIITIAINSCGKSETKKSELIYENGNQKVEIRILNGKDYLEYDKSTKTNFVLTNIELNSFSVYGAGIRILGTKNGTMKTEIKVPSNYLDTDTLNVKVRFGKKQNENYAFKIPMKTAE